MSKTDKKFKSQLKNKIDKTISWYDSEYLIEFIVFFLNKTAKIYDKHGHHLHAHKHAAQMRKAARMLKYSLTYVALNCEREVYKSEKINPHEFFIACDDLKGFSTINPEWTEWNENNGNDIINCIKRREIFRPGNDIKEFHKHCNEQVIKIRKYAFNYIADHMGAWWD